MESKRPFGIDFDKDKLKIGLNVSCHGWILQAKYQDRVINECEKACRDLIDNFGAKIIFLQHTIYESKVINELSKKLQIQVANYPPSEMKWIYDNLDLVIGMQMHSAIFAFGSCIPIVNIAYDCKNYIFMKMINQGDKVIDVRSINSEDLIKTVCRTLDSSKAIKNDFKQLKNEFWRKHVSFIKSI